MKKIIIRCPKEFSDGLVQLVNELLRSFSVKCSKTTDEPDIMLVLEKNAEPTLVDRQVFSVPAWNISAVLVLTGHSPEELVRKLFAHFGKAIGTIPEHLLVESSAPTGEAEQVESVVSGDKQGPQPSRVYADQTAGAGATPLPEKRRKARKGGYAA